MQIQRGYKVRIYPNKEQQEKMLKTIHACRWVYNHYLDKRKNAYLENKETIKYKDLSKDLVKLRHNTDWLEEVQFQPLQQSLRQLDTAYNNFFRKTSMFPKFKSSKNSKLSFRKATGWSIKDNKINIEKDMVVRFRGKFVKERRGTLTITADNLGKWWASTIGYEERERPRLNKEGLGIDLGIKDLAITSNGKKYKNPNFLRRDLKRLKKAQQDLSRKKKNSNRGERAKKEVVRLHNKIANKRNNYLHHVSKAITSENQAFIAVEDLAVPNMMKNRKLSKSISDTSWSELARQIQYKQEWLGGKFIKIDRFFPSSKMCSNCNFILDTLPLNIRKWTCPKCKTKHDRDYNASINIKKAGYQLYVESAKD